MVIDEKEYHKNIYWYLTPVAVSTCTMQYAMIEILQRFIENIGEIPWVQGYCGIGTKIECTYGVVHD